MKTRKLKDVTFRCAGNPEDTLTIQDDGGAAGFIQDGRSVYLHAADINTVIRRLKKIRKRIRARLGEERTRL